MTNLTIHPIAFKTPEMTEEMFADLKADIEKQGQLVPVMVWCNQVIDGRHRMRACAELGIEPKAKHVACAEEELPAMVLALNGKRNHLTPSQRAAYAAEMANLSHGSNRHAAKVDAATSASSPISVRAAAESVGVHHTMVTRAKTVQREAAPEVFDAVKKGHLTLHAAGEITKTVPLEQQAEVAAKVIAGSKGKKKQSVSAVTGGGIRKAQKRNERIEALLGRALVQLDVAVEAIERYGDRATPTTEERAEWLATIDRAATGLRHFKAHLREEAA